MRLLIITQKIDKNDDILGFFHGWVEKFAEKSSKVYVIANYVGEYKLPENARISSLGKEKGFSRLKRYFLFYKFLFQNIKRVDTAFFHMCPEYAIAGGLIIKLYKKRSMLWYTHKAITLNLWLAEKIVDKIFTASKESFRLPSKKIGITGHGIDINQFSAKGRSALGGKVQIITAGRIAPVKNLHILIEAAEILKNRNFIFEIRIAGAPILEKDKIYFEELKRLTKEKKLDDKVIFIGSIPNKNIAEFYQNGDLFINLSDTGSIDKAALEAMACDLKILTSNEAFKNILPLEYLTSKNPEEIANKIIALSKAAEDPSLREYVVKNHNLDSLINKITNSSLK